MQQTKLQTPQIPREAWASHRNYPDHVLLLGSHEAFRSANATLIDLARTIEAPSQLEWPYRRWISGMRSHEAYEEYKLYPYLARRWEASFATAEAGHVALHEKHAGVLSAFGELRTSADARQARAALVAALEAHDETLRAHLRVEEDLVIPLLLELSPEEFKRYTRSTVVQLGLQKRDTE